MWRACQRLNEVLAGRELTRSEFRVPSLAATDLTGVGVREVISRGKHQLFRFSNDFTLHTHFRMDGAWKIYPRGGAGVVDRRLKSEPCSRPMIMMQWDIGFPSSSCFRRRRRTQSWGISGPTCWGPTGTSTRLSGGSPLSPTARSVRRYWISGTWPVLARSIARSCFSSMAFIRVRRSTKSRNLRRVVERGQQLLQANRWRPEQSTTGDLRHGRRSYVYERSGQPCRRCGTPIRTEELGPRGEERRSYWCPHCQPVHE